MSQINKCLPLFNCLTAKNYLRLFCGSSANDNFFVFLVFIFMLYVILCPLSLEDIFIGY